jgi:hypothetical protein
MLPCIKQDVDVVYKITVSPPKVPIDYAYDKKDSLKFNEPVFLVWDYAIQERMDVCPTNLPNTFDQQNIRCGIHGRRLQSVLTDSAILSAVLRN